MPMEADALPYPNASPGDSGGVGTYADAHTYADVGVGAGADADDDCSGNSGVGRNA